MNTLRVSTNFGIAAIVVLLLLDRTLAVVGLSNQPMIGIPLAVLVGMFAAVLAIRHLRSEPARELRRTK